MDRGDGSICVHVLDDDACVREALHRLLRAAGMQVQSWASAAELLTRGDTIDSGCVLLDISACRGEPQVMARLLERGHDLPLIAFSGDEGEAVESDARAAGARLLFRKPVDAQALIDAIRWLAHEGARKGEGQ